MRTLPTGRKHVDFNALPRSMTAPHGAASTTARPDRFLASGSDTDLDARDAPTFPPKCSKDRCVTRMLVDLCAVYPDLSGFREAFFGRIFGIHHLPGIIGG
jgi:hypothetical protein